MDVEHALALQVVHDVHVLPQEPPRGDVLVDDPPQLLRGIEALGAKLAVVGVVAGARLEVADRNLVQDGDGPLPEATGPDAVDAPAGAAETKRVQDLVEGLSGEDRTHHLHEGHEPVQEPRVAAGRGVVDVGANERRLPHDETQLPEAAEEEVRVLDADGQVVVR